MSFSESARMSHEFRKPPVKPVTIFRGCLEIGDLKIAVQAYKREQMAKKLKFNRLSGRVQLVCGRALSGIADVYATPANLTDVLTDRRAQLWSCAANPQLPQE